MPKFGHGLHGLKMKTFDLLDRNRLIWWQSSSYTHNCLPACLPRLSDRWRFSTTCLNLPIFDVIHVVAVAKWNSNAATASSALTAAAAANVAVAVAVGVAVGSQRWVSMRFCQLKVKIKTKSKCNELLGMQLPPTQARSEKGGVVRRGKKVAKAAALEKFKLCAKRPTATATTTARRRKTMSIEWQS